MKWFFLLWFFLAFTGCSSHLCKDEDGNVVSCSKLDVDHHTRFDRE